MHEHTASVLFSKSHNLHSDVEVSTTAENVLYVTWLLCHESTCEFLFVQKLWFQRDWADWVKG